MKRNVAMLESSEREQLTEITRKGSHALSK